MHASSVSIKPMHTQVSSSDMERAQGSQSPAQQACAFAATRDGQLPANTNTQMRVPGIGTGNHPRDRPCTGLPLGFRFRPTDEELLTHYLARKAADVGFASAAVCEVDLYKAEPWDLLPAAGAGDDDGCRYFFCARRVKFASGLRTNRATPAGYWKSTGKDKVVLRHAGDERGVPLGMKKMLVFYRGRAPRGVKTSWIMHEYRMFMKKPPGEAIQEQEQETILLPPCADHPQTMSTDGKTPAAATAGQNSSSDAEAIAPDDHETYQDLPPLNHEDLLMNCPETDDTSSSSALAQATLLFEDVAASSSFDVLPQLLDYEDFPFV